MYKNLIKFTVLYGELLIYGDNAEFCRPYIATADIDSVEDLCIYCQQHQLKIFHLPNKNLHGYLEIFRVRKLTKKYSVYSSWDDLSLFLKEQQELNQ